jgi:hypothetical protein
LNSNEILEGTRFVGILTCSPPLLCEQLVTCDDYDVSLLIYVRVSECFLYTDTSLNSNLIDMTYILKLVQ